MVWWFGNRGKTMIDARCVMLGDRLYAGMDEEQRDIMPHTNAILLQCRSIEDLKAAMRKGVCVSACSSSPSLRKRMKHTPECQARFREYKLLREKWGEYRQTLMANIDTWPGQERSDSYELLD